MKVYGELQVAQLETFTAGTRPSFAAYPSRVIWLSDSREAQVSDGTQWISLGGSGGGALKWVEGPNSPVFNLSANGFEVYTYSQNNILRTIIRCPRATTPKLKTFFYTDIVGTISFDAKAYLIRPGSTDVNSALTPNVNTKSVVIGGGDVNEAQAVTFDLATAGAINAVALQADDLILIEIVRTDANVGEVNQIAYATEISFV